MTPYKDLRVLFSAKDNEVKNNPFFLTRVYNQNVEVAYINCKKTLYVLGYIPSTQNVVKLFKPKRQEETLVQRARGKRTQKGWTSSEDTSDQAFKDLKDKIMNMKVVKSMNPDIVQLDLSESYIDMQKKSKDRSNIMLGAEPLNAAIHTLCSSENENEIAHAMQVSIGMLSELFRFRDVKEFVRVHYINGGKLGEELRNLQNNWMKMSELLLKFVDDEVEFEIKIGSRTYTPKKLSNALLVAKPLS